MSEAAARAKIFTSEMAIKVTNDALRLLGRRLPQTRDGYLNAMSQNRRRRTAWPRTR